MAYVITQPCVGLKDASCVEVCPVDCIHSDDASDMYFIDPDECIDCGACVDPCPVDAIFPEDEGPGDQTQFIKINAASFHKYVGSVARHAVTLIPGDGVGPEIADATVRVLEATGVEFDWDVQQAGENVMAEYGTPLPAHVLG